jgi:hypothetical protein
VSSSVNEESSIAFLKVLARENKLYCDTVLRRFFDGSHGVNPFTGEILNVAEVTLRECLESTGIVKDEDFRVAFKKFVESVIIGVSWGLLMEHDCAGEGDSPAFCIREHGGEDLVPYLHELWSQVQGS